MQKIYAGIGSRETPAHILDRLEKMATYLANRGFILRSGGADGADSAFEKGCDSVSGKKEIYLPWKGFNKNDSTLCNITPIALKMAENYHPAWNRLKEPAKSLMARNCYQVLGYDLNEPADFIACWTKDGKASGGTGQALRIAKTIDIPIFNFHNERAFDDLKQWLKKQLELTNPKGMGR